jgi:hypothetical protein
MSFFRVRIVGRLHGSQTINVLHFRANTGVLDPNALREFLLALSAAVFACVLDTLIPAVTSDWTFVKTDAQKINAPISDAIESTAQAGVVGQLGVTSVSFQASLVNLKTGANGRRGRGKLFLPPPGEAQIANSIMDNVTSNLLEAFLQCMFDKFVGGSRTESAEWCVLSRADAGALLGDISTAMRPIVQATPQTVIARMGSRKVGVGS